MIENLLPLFQLTDSNFPNGSFTQSFGFETYINEGKITDPDTFEAWLDVFFKDQLVTSDGLGLRMTYDALKNNKMGEVWHTDRLLSVQNMARETREGTEYMGKSLTKIAVDIYDFPIIKAYYERIKSKLSFGHPAVVYAIVGQYLKISKETVIALYLYNTIVNFVQNAVRAIPIGQTAGQQIVYRFHDKIEKATDRILKMDRIEFGSIAPGIEVAQMQHERVKARMFMS